MRERAVLSHAREAFVRAGSFALLVKFAADTLKLAMGSRGKASLRRLMAIALDRNSALFALFFGSLCGVWNLVFRTLEGKVSDQTASTLAGAAAGCALTLVKGQTATWRPIFVLFAAAKAAEYTTVGFAQRWQHREPSRGHGGGEKDVGGQRQQPPPPTPRLLRWLEVAVFSLSCFEIMQAWFWRPELLPKAYNKWITLMAEMDLRLLGALRGLHHGTLRYGVKSNVLRTYCIDNGLDPALGDLATHVPVPPVVVHPEDQHTGGLLAVAMIWLRGFRRSAMLYGPVHLLPLLVFLARGSTKRRRKKKKKMMMKMRGRRGRGMRKGEEIEEQGVDEASTLSLVAQRIPRVVGAVARSSAFLATFIATIWAAILATRRIRKNDTDLGPAIGCALCGLSLLVEKPSRRRELAVYVMPRALQTAINARPGLARVWREGGGDLCVFVIAAALISRAFVCEPEAIRPSQRWLFERYFGWSKRGRSMNTGVIEHEGEGR